MHLYSMSLQKEPGDGKTQCGDISHLCFNNMIPGRTEATEATEEVVLVVRSRDDSSHAQHGSKWVHGIICMMLVKATELVVRLNIACQGERKINNKESIYIPVAPKHLFWELN